MRDSQFVYKDDKIIPIKASKKIDLLIGTKIQNYPDYTTNELLEWLPADKTSVSKFQLNGKKSYVALFSEAGELNARIKLIANTPQDALCFLLIELITKDIIK